MMKDDTKNKEKEKTEDNVQETIEPTEEMQTLKLKLEECENKYKRALADYQNLEKRVREDRIGLIKLANKELLLRLLPVLDTLFLAQKHSNDQSFQVSAQQFLDALKDEGVTKIDTVGQAFNPEIMEAVGTGEGEEGKVLEEVRSGFLLHEQLLRAAQVIVGQSS